MPDKDGLERWERELNFLCANQWDANNQNLWWIDNYKWWIESVYIEDRDYAKQAIISSSYGRYPRDKGLSLGDMVWNARESKSGFF